MAKSVVANAAVSLTLQSTEFSKAVGTAKAEAKSLSATMREESAKSRESVKLLSEELSLGIPRGLQKIISTLPGVTSAMNLAFDAVVVFALINTVVEVTKKVEEFIKKNDELAKKHAEAWGNISSSMGHVNDGLQVTSDKLQESIDKLEHKPHNGIKDAIDEAAKAADDLNEKLSGSLKQIIEATTMDAKNGLFGTSFLSQKFQNESPDDIAKGVQNQLGQIDAGTYLKENPQSSAGPEKDDQMREVYARAAEHTKVYLGQLNSYQDRYNKAKAQADLNVGGASPWDPMNLHSAAGFGDGGDETEGIKDFSDVKTSATNLLGALNQGLHGIDLTKTIQQQQKQYDTDNAAREASAQKMKGLEDLYNRQKDETSETAVAGFWPEALKQFSQSSDEYRTIQAKILSQTAEWAKQLTEIGKHAKDAINFDSDPNAVPNINKMLEDQASAVDHAGESWKQYNAEIARGNDQYNAFLTKQSEQNNEFLEKGQEDQVKDAVSRGMLNPHDAAMQMASIHQSAFKAQMDAMQADFMRQLKTLQAQVNQIQMDSSLTPEQRETGVQGVNNQISDLARNNTLKMSSLTNANSIQGGQDQFDLAQTNFSTRMTEDLTKWAEQATDLGNIMGTLFTESINQVNDAIIKILTEKNSGQHPFRQAGHAIFTDVSKEGLQSAEGSLFKLFGKSGKDVQKVQVVNWPHGSGPGGSGGGPDGAGTGILGMLNRSNWAGNLFGGKLFGPGGIFDRGQPGISGPGSGGPINQGGAPLSMDNVSDFAPGAPGWVGQMTKYAGIALGAGLGAIEKGAQAPGDSGDDGDSAPGSGSTMQGIPITGSFQGVEAHASGGLLSANTWSLVGENGPELLPPVGQTTRVYDARDTSAMLGGGGNTTNHSWNIDARGSTDPAAVHAAVIRGIKQAAPQLISSAHASSNDHKARKPSSAR